MSCPGRELTPAHIGTIDLIPERPSRPGVAFALLAVMQATLIAGITVITVALPAVQRDLHTTRAGIALATSAFGLSFGGLLMLGGRLADRLGRRRVFRSGVAVFVLGSVAVAVAPDIATLVAARFLQGVGAALVAPAALALLGNVYPHPRERSRVSALWGGVNGIGTTIGVLLSGAVVTFGSWRLGFGAPAVVGAVVFVLAPRLLPAPPTRRTRLDVGSAVLVTTGVSAASFGLLEAAETPLSSLRVWASLAAGAVILAAFFVRQARLAEPLLPLSFLTSRRRATGVAAIFVMAGGMATTVFLLSLFFQQEAGYPPLLTSAAFLPYAALQVATGLLAGRIVTRFGTRAVTAVGLLLVALGLALLAGMGAHSAYVGLPLAGLLAFAAGAALTFASAMSAATSGVPDEHAGIAAGVVNTAMETGPTVGFAVLVALGDLAFPVAAAAFATTAVTAVFTLKGKGHT